jgi:uncharacterized surface protein with fasciclin (FAS1) repeats
MKRGEKIVRMSVALALVGAISSQILGGEGRAIAQIDQYSVSIRNNNRRDVITGATVALIGYGIYNMAEGTVAPAVPAPNAPISTAPPAPIPLPQAAPHSVPGEIRTVSGGAFDPIYDVAKSSEEFRTFHQAIEIASYEEKGEEDLVRRLRKEKDFTVFMPTDSAFGKLPGGINALLSDPKNAQNRAALRSFLFGHIVSGRYTIADLQKMPDGQTLPALNGKTLTITHRDRDIFLGKSRIVRTDILCNNGIIHPIEEVLPQDK